MEKVMAFSESPEERKAHPIATGVLDYFPLSMWEVAGVSFQGNKQHHGDTPLHWDRSKSTDEADALIRHFLQRGTLDSDGMRHTAKMVWRSLALLEKELEQAERDANAKETDDTANYLDMVARAFEGR